MIARFVELCKESYHDNAYHNFRHAVDVMQALYSFLHVLGVCRPIDQPERPIQYSPVLSKVDGLALMFAGIGHDLGHPGLSNAFMVC